MTETFYRFHWAECPEFSAANARSVLWGAERNEDGTKTRCADCNGKGRVFEFDEDDCTTCDGEGWEDAMKGYSACHTAEDLITYFAERGGAKAHDDADGRVIIFAGRQVGNGPDGEPLAVPSRTIETLDWSALLERTQP